MAIVTGRSLATLVGALILGGCAGASTRLGAASEPPAELTSAPEIPDYLPPPDSLRFRSGPEVVYARTQAEVMFQASATSETILAVFRKYRMEVVGGKASARAYIVRISDPGADEASLGAFYEALNREPGVEAAAPRMLEGPPLGLQQDTGR